MHLINQHSSNVLCFNVIIDAQLLHKHPPQALSKPSLRKRRKVDEKGKIALPDWIYKWVQLLANMYQQYQFVHYTVHTYRKKIYQALFLLLVSSYFFRSLETYMPLISTWNEQDIFSPSFYDSIGVLAWCTNEGFLSIVCFHVIHINSPQPP